MKAKHNSAVQAVVAVSDKAQIKNKMDSDCWKTVFKHATIKK
jgi:hypothetical protein